MARCKLGEKKIEKLKKQTGLNIVKALTRGNTNHRIDLFVENGTMVYLFKNGIIAKVEDIQKYK